MTTPEDGLSYDQLPTRHGSAYDCAAADLCIEVLYTLLGEEPVRVDQAQLALAGLENVLRGNNEAHAALLAENARLRETAAMGQVDVEGTGLPNRKAFDSALKHWGETTTSQDSRRRGDGDDVQLELRKTLVLLDLNNFKLINDVLEWDEGDRILQIVAELLRKSVREDDAVYRYAGDEFAILASHTSEILSLDVAAAIECRFNGNLRALCNAQSDVERARLLPEGMVVNAEDHEAVRVVGAHFGSSDLPPGQSYEVYDGIVKEVLRTIRNEKEDLAIR